MGSAISNIKIKLTNHFALVCLLYSESINQNSEEIMNSAGEAKRIYPCIFVFAYEKKKNGIRNQMETTIRL